VLLVSLVLSLAACSGDSQKEETAKGPDPERGRKLYLINCTVCHNRNPALDGATGPAVQGSSETLLRYRVLTHSYPPGYVPKRKSSAMPAYPHLKNAIPDLAAYLR
jgi:mono/diheme cytochrome c family protein